MTPTAPVLISGAQLDQRLGISRATRYRWVRAGYLPRPVRIGPGAARWLLAEIEELERLAAEDRQNRDGVQ